MSCQNIRGCAGLCHPSPSNPTTLPGAGSRFAGTRSAESLHTRGFAITFPETGDPDTILQDAKQISSPGILSDNTIFQTICKKIKNKKKKSVILYLVPLITEYLWLSMSFMELFFLFLHCGNTSQSQLETFMALMRSQLVVIIVYRSCE